MTKIEIIDYNSWSPYEGFAEGSGRSEKIWLQSSEGRIGLFKFPKIDPKINDITTEHIIIGNTDRHQNNWAVLNRYMCEDKNNIYEACPLYDNGSSLCCYVNGEMIESYLGRDKKRFQALVDSKSQSMIRIDGYVKKLPTHREVVTY